MNLNLRFKIIQTTIYLLLVPVLSQNGDSGIGPFKEVFAWKQITYNVDGMTLTQDRFGSDQDSINERYGQVYFNNNQNDEERIWDQSHRTRKPSSRPTLQNPNIYFNRPSDSSPSTTTAPPSSPANESRRIFIQYNNVPMGMEKVGNRVFVALPRRRYGIPSTLNYIDLREDSGTRSPALRPFPDRGSTLTSVYRTRADTCGRLWMVDTGLLEIPDNPQQVQPPAIVVFDLKTGRQILRYPFNSSDIPAANTPTGLASITVDITNGDCRNAFAYVPDLTTYGLIVYSLRDNQSWRLSHNYFHFNPAAGTLNISGHRFQWNDGIFSLTLGPPSPDGCRTGYFHPLISTQEFAVSTCLLKNRTASEDSNYWAQYALAGERGENSQSTMHDYHLGTNVIFFADVGRDAVTCWNTAKLLTPANVAVLARDTERLSYPSDLHVTDNEVWVMANKLPRFGYSRLNTEEYNFFIYKADVHDAISGTVCAESSPSYNRPGYSNNYA